MSTTKVFVLDDHRLIREAIARLLADDEDVELVGEASTAAEGLEGIARSQPDVALIDVGLPDGDGIELCREIRSRHPDVRCLIFTGAEDSMVDALVAGAVGYVTKGLGGREIVAAVKRAATGGPIAGGLPPQAVIDRLRAERSSPLTRQEQKVLELIGRGLTNRQIAGELHLAEQTVKNYVSQILSKLGMQRRAQAAVYVASKQRQRGGPGGGGPEGAT